MCPPVMHLCRQERRWAEPMRPVPRRDLKIEPGGARGPAPSSLLGRQPHRGPLGAWRPVGSLSRARLPSRAHTTSPEDTGGGRAPSPASPRRVPSCQPRDRRELLAGPEAVAMTQHSLSRGTGDMGWPGTSSLCVSLEGHQEPGLRGRRGQAAGSLLRPPGPCTVCPPLACPGSQLTLAP